MRWGIVLCLVVSAWSLVACAGEYRLDSRDDKTPAKAAYTLDGAYMQSVEAPEDLVGLAPPFTITARIQPVDNGGQKTRFGAELIIDMCQVDAKGLPKEEGIETRYWFRVNQDEGTDMAYFSGETSCYGALPDQNLLIHFSAVQELVARVSVDGSVDCWVNVDDGEGGFVRLPLVRTSACIDNGVLLSWRAPTWRTVWLDWISITGAQVPDHNAGSDKENSGDVNGDGETNAADIQIIINKVLGVANN